MVHRARRTLRRRSRGGAHRPATGRRRGTMRRAPVVQHRRSVRPGEHYMLLRAAARRVLEDRRPCTHAALRRQTGKHACATPASRPPERPGRHRGVGRSPDRREQPDPDARAAHHPERVDRAGARSTPARARRPTRSRRCSPSRSGRCSATDRRWRSGASAARAAVRRGGRPRRSGDGVWPAPRRVPDRSREPFPSSIALIGPGLSRLRLARKPRAWLRGWARPRRSTSREAATLAVHARRGRRAPGPAHASDRPAVAAEAEDRPALGAGHPWLTNAMAIRSSPATSRAAQPRSPPRVEA